MTKTADERAIVCYLELDRANFLLMFAGVDGAVGIIEEHLIEYGKQEREAGRQDGLREAMEMVMYGGAE